MPAARQAALFELIDRLRALELRVVLVGGLVPPLLIEALEPAVFPEDIRMRRTRDCDLAVEIAAGAAGHQQVGLLDVLLGQLGYRRGRDNQFRWSHPSGLLLDLLPVPDGVERGDPDAVAIARTWVESDAPTFYRGYELALDEPVDVLVDQPEGAPHALRVAGLAPMLAMKLQAWIDREERRKDAHDVALLVRHIHPDRRGAELRRTAARDPSLVDQILDRLERDFTDAWHRGVLAYASEAFGWRDDDETEADREAVASATRRAIDVARLR
ncbi:MAG TPA: hypothetical protein VHE35_37640 [Kofleriaceae bacterium]|nr:hypothetical protein [Kofleriaceae bacterium]